MMSCRRVSEGRPGHDQGGKRGGVNGVNVGVNDHDKGKKRGGVNGAVRAVSVVSEMMCGVV